MNEQPVAQVASAETARHHLEMLKKHLEVLRELKTDPMMLRIVEKAIRVAEQRVVDLQGTR